jgi:hypothetical protein
MPNNMMVKINIVHIVHLISGIQGLHSSTGKPVGFCPSGHTKTRFLLASHLSPSRGAREARILMDKAEARAGKTPKLVFTDGLGSYLVGIELAYGADAKHRVGGPWIAWRSIRTGTASRGG